MADPQAAASVVGTVITYTGATAFGALVGWFTYYINRYRKGDVQFSDVTTLVGVIGGGAITGQFGGTAAFGAYGIGLALGFFAYFALLWRLVSRSPNFDEDWFLDGRRIGPQPPYVIPSDIRQTVAPVALPADGITTATATATATVMALQQAGLFGTRFVQAVPPPRNAAEHIDPGEAHFAEALSIDDLDLAASARKGAAALLLAHPNVVFTSGRRDVSGQASAMAGNVAANRKWIEQTYKASTERDALQAWVDANPSATTKAAIAQG